MDAITALWDRWLNEASDLALNGNPKRAGYVEYMADRLMDRPIFGYDHPASPSESMARAGDFSRG